MVLKIVEKFVNKFKKNVLEEKNEEEKESDIYGKNYGELEYHIKKFKRSKTREDMLNSVNYYNGEHDVLKKRRLILGDNGDLVEVANLENNKIVDNQFKKLVDQKTNYLFGKPLTFYSPNKMYLHEIKNVFDKKFFKDFNYLGQDVLICGIGWLYAYYDEQGRFNFKRFNPIEICPVWKDNEHTELSYAIRIYEVSVFDGNKYDNIEKVEVYDQSGISFFCYKDERLVPETPFEKTYLQFEGESFNWLNIPLVPFKLNHEKPLLNDVKTLQDGINSILSNFQDAMAENMRNTILVLVNYDGENLGEFRRNLATYGAIKVRSEQGETGDVKSLQVEVNSENYTCILNLLKKAIIENGRGFDAKDDRMGTSPNQMNIQSMYSDIDLDANSLELEFAASLDYLFNFLNIHLLNCGLGDFTNEKIDFIFNRDMLINTSELIAEIKNSVGIVSMETLIAKHPFVLDYEFEIKKLEQSNQLDAITKNLEQLEDLPSDSNNDSPKTLSDEEV